MPFTPRPLSCLFVTLSLVGGAATAAQADTSLYDQALESLRTQLEAVEQPPVCGFDFQHVAQDAPIFSFRQTAENAEWLDAEGGPVDLEETPLPLDGRNMIALRSSMFESVEAPQLLRDEAGVAVFGIRTEEFTINGMGQEVNIAEHLMGEVGVSRETGQFVFVRYYAPESFKPAPIARFRTFDHRVEIAPAWNEGPLVRTQARTSMRVSAMFQNHEIDDGGHYSEFQACT